MQLIEVPAKAGYVWFRQGYLAVPQKPALAFLTLFFTYLLAMTLVSQIPVIGGVLPLIFIPGVAVGFMAACRNTIAGKPVFPTILADGFHSYGPVAAKRLLLLGVLYVAAMALVLAGSALADGGMLLKVMLGGALDQDAIANSNIPLAVITALAFYIPVAMIFWFSPILVAWHEVPPVKAMFFSIVSCWRNRGAFIVFGALWFAVATTVSLGLSALMQALGAADFAFAILMPATMIVTTMLYCSFYATYRGCFGVQTSENADLPTTPAN